MGRNRIGVLAAIGGAMVVILLCVVVGVTSFFVGRRTVESGLQPPVVAREEAVQVATPSAEATAPLPPTAPVATLESPSPAAPAETETESGSVSPPAATRNQSTPRVTDGEFDQGDLDLLWEVWDTIQREFDGELPGEEELSYAVIRGLVDSLDDPHTRFIDPAAAIRMQERFEGAYDGIGAYVQENDDGLTEIVRPISGAPAEDAGLRPGDVVVAVDGESVIGKGLEEVISYILGPPGTDVVITFVRDNATEPFDVTITRAHIVIPVVVSEMLDDDIAYIELVSFNSIATEQLQLALDELLAQNPRGLILDLRNNGGGLLNQSVSVADLFLPESVILYERNAKGAINEVFRASDGQIAEEIPLVVLINEFSASASEIVAGAIRDSDRGVLIGETTFGKGSVQMQHTLSDGSQLNVTIAHWYTPSDVNIDEEGIVPDIEVEMDETEPVEDRADDVQLQRAIDYLQNGD
jgi:carboxyl-terminal processing protease